MSQATTEPHFNVEDVRAKLFADLVPKKVYAKATDRSERTVDRQIAKGEVVTVKVGRDEYIVLSATREKIMSTQRAGHEPVRRGRPAGRKARTSQSIAA